MVAVVNVLCIVELRGGEGGEECVVIRIGQRSIQRTLLTEGCGMPECGSVNAYTCKKITGAYGWGGPAFSASWGTWTRDNFIRYDHKLRK